METAWDRLSSTRAFTFDDGLLRKILDVAGRWGKPALSSRVLNVLATRSLPINEHHMTAVLQAYVNAGQVPEALRAISEMRLAGLTPTLESVEPVISSLTSADIVDQAFYGLEDISRSGDQVDVIALNALIKASLRLGDIQRVRATQAAASNFGVQCNEESFNLVLEGCVSTGHRALGDAVLTDMAAAGVTPNQDTYELMVNLCLPPAMYEDAFYYLEKMKTSGYTPSASVYNSILRKCLGANDERWKLVQKEMASIGHSVDLESRNAIVEAKGRRL